MKRVTACILLAAAIVGCNEGVIAPPSLEDEAAAKGIRMSSPKPAEHYHDTIQLQPEGGPQAAASFGVTGPAGVEGGDGVHYNLIKVARIPAPVVGANTVQANDILISGSSAYIAYNYQGTPWIGAIQAIDISSPETPQVSYQVDLGTMDINSVGLDGSRLLFAGAADPTVWEGDTPAFAAYMDATAPDPGDILTTMRLLPSYAGTGIRRFGSSYYVSVGALNGSIQVLDGVTFNPVDALDFADVRDLDVSGLGLVAVAGTTDNDAPLGRVITGVGSSPTEISLVDFGSDYHKATVEVYGQGTALLGLSEAGFKILDVGTSTFIHEEPNPTPLVDGLLTNTNSASTDGTFIVTANGEYGFRVLRPIDGDFSDVDVVGYFASELPPQGNLETKFSVNHVAMSNGCFFAAAGAWGVYVYCFEEALPEIAVTKTATPNTIGWGSGGLGDFVPDRTFTEDGDGIPPDEFFFGHPTCDDAGPDDQPNQVDFNCMARADNLTGLLGLQWTWDATGVWTGSGQTGDGCALLDTDENGDANFAACVRIENDPETGDIRQIGGDGAVFFYSCGDGRDDRCSSQIALLENVGSTTCSIALVANSLEGSGNANSQDDPTNDVEATCEVDLALFGGAETVNLLNVCAYPSGEPNSNPFDCVVTPGSGFLRITKLVDPDVVDLFGFTLSPGATDETSKYAVQSGVTSALIPLAPGSAYSLTELIPSGWFLEGASCTLNGESTGQLDHDLAQVSGIESRRGQTTVCTFENFASTDGTVTYEIVVTNLGGGFEPVTLDSLVDDIFGDLNGVENGDCVTGGTIALLESYTCSFTRTLTGAPGDEHTNTVTAVASDDDGSDEASDSETVTFVVEPEDPQE